jgi:ribulose-phosphate 3-epimerase
MKNRNNDIEVVPSINVSNFEEVKERIAKVERYVRWCHLDITDGIFSKHPTWNNPADVMFLDTTLKAEAHLMVTEPERVIEHWLIAPVKRIIIHLEAAKDLDFIIKKCREAGVEIGIAINPETSWEKLGRWCGKVDLFLILTVKPGPSGQKMEGGSFEKIVRLRYACPSSKIEIDGGINPETAKLAIKAGVNLLVAGAYIFNHQDPAKALEELLK